MIETLETSQVLTNLKDGRGDAWAGHNKDSAFFSLLMKDNVRVSWENLGTADPIGSVGTTSESAICAKVPDCWER